MLNKNEYFDKLFISIDTDIKAKPKKLCNECEELYRCKKATWSEEQGIYVRFVCLNAEIEVKAKEGK